MGNDYFFQVEQAVTMDAGCIFVLDDGSSDIASFSKATGYHRVGKYFDSSLLANFLGGSLALTPNGKFLYASYSATFNLGVWGINPDCGLTLVAVTNISAGAIRVTPNGRYLIASDQGSAEEFAIDKVSGTLTYLGATKFSRGACANETACTPYGIDVTKDSKLAVFASFAPNVTRQYSIPVALTARITANGLASPRTWTLKNPAGLFANFFPLFGAASYAGSGDMYFATQGQVGIGDHDPGVLTASFTAHPLSVKLKGAVALESAPENLDGNIAVTGNVMVIAEYPNQIGVFRIQKDGSLKLLSTTTIDEQGEGLFSLSIFPNTR